MTRLFAVLLVVAACAAGACIDTDSHRCSYNRGCAFARGGCCTTAPIPVT